MKISCLCPTYKRPHLLTNAIACFEQQDFPFDAELIVFDDADQFTSKTWEVSGKPNLRVRVFSQRTRFASIPEKYNYMIRHFAHSELFVIWEDDDMFLPNHLSTIFKQADAGVQFITPSLAFSTYGQVLGDVILECAKGRFHSSWAFTRAAWEAVGGYPEDEYLDFDQRFGGSMARLGLQEYYDIPTYVYRPNHNSFRGSQVSGPAYIEFYRSLNVIPADKVINLQPKLDFWTQLVFDTIKNKRFKQVSGQPLLA